MNSHLTRDEVDYQNRKRLTKDAQEWYGQRFCPRPYKIPNRPPAYVLVKPVTREVDIDYEKRAMLDHGIWGMMR